MKANRNHTEKLFSVVRRFLTAGAGVATIAGVLYVASSDRSAAGDTNAPVAAASIPKATDPKTTAKPDKKAEAQPKRELSGAELYAIHCNRCHAERYPAEFTDGQWKTLMTHMRVRANLPAKQARLILDYLQDESGHY
jgi:cytochrome c5